MKRRDFLKAAAASLLGFVCPSYGMTHFMLRVRRPPGSREIWFDYYPPKKLLVIFEEIRKTLTIAANENRKWEVISSIGLTGDAPYRRPDGSYEFIIRIAAPGSELRPIEQTSVPPHPDHARP